MLGVVNDLWLLVFCAESALRSQRLGFRDSGSGITSIAFGPMHHLSHDGVMSLFS